MVSVIAMEVIDGVAKKVQRITYNNGLKVRRIYNKVGDIVPAKVEFLNKELVGVIQKGAR